MVKKVIKNLDSSKASGSNCIPVVVIKNYDPELSYILAELFHMCLKESCFSDCWKVSSVAPVLNNVGETSMAKNYLPVSLLSVVSKEFSYYILMTFVMILFVILLSMLMILFSTLNQASDLWQQLELASELESVLQDTVDLGEKWLVYFNAGKLN